MIGRDAEPAEGKLHIVVGFPLSLGPWSSFRRKGDRTCFQLCVDHWEKSKEAEEGEGNSTPGDQGQS